MTGFSQATRRIIAEREGGRCARCGNPILSGGHMHHRRPRGAGSSWREATNLPANGLHVCPACHDWIESNRTAAYVNGWLVPSYQLPAEVPVLYRDEWIHLDDDGSLNPV